MKKGLLEELCKKDPEKLCKSNFLCCGCDGINLDLVIPFCFVLGFYFSVKYHYKKIMRIFLCPIRQGRGVERDMTFLILHFIMFFYHIYDLNVRILCNKCVSECRQELLTMC